MTHPNGIGFCAFIGCPNDRALFAPMCQVHLLEAWRFVEANPRLKPSTAPALSLQERAARRAQEPVVRPKLDGVVYYIQRKNGRIKIGTTTNLAQRTTTGLQERWPDAVLAAEWGGREVEAERHAQFASDRHYNGASSTEEFTASARLLMHIDRVRAEYGDPVAMDQELVERNHAIYLAARRADL